mmetsp:Transcript_36556/g.74458  ORF Transcript_36556/g.74458 Transcript_36556/m.74458 type:complete len:95 (-) Transcript_36556:2808-3092(-)
MLDVKKEISDALSGGGAESSSSSAASTDVSPSRMRLYLNEKGTDILPDSSTIAQHEIANDNALYVVFRKAGKEGDDDDDDDCWEPVEIDDEMGE